MSMETTQSGSDRELRQSSIDEGWSLGDYLGLIWRFKVVIIGAALVAGAIAFAVSMSTPRSFEATVTFEVAQSKIGDPLQNSGGGSTTSNTPASFRPMVESLSTAAAVIKELGLPSTMTASDFLDNIMNVDEVRGTNLLTVKASYPDPVMAAKIANSIADHAVQTARRVSGTEAAHARDLIKEQLDGSLQRLDAAETRYREYRQQVRVEAMRKDVETRLGGPQLPVFTPSSASAVPLPGGRTQTTSGPVNVSVLMENQSDGRMGVAQLTAKIASERARLNELERDLSNRTKANASAPATSTYQNIDAAAAAARASVAALEQNRSELLASRPIDPGTSALLDKLYSVESELARRQIERDLAQGMFSDLSQRYQDANLQVISRSAEFVVIDPAMPPDRPASRHVARNTAVAMGIWLSLAIAGVLMWDSVQRRRASR